MEAIITTNYPHEEKVKSTEPEVIVNISAETLRQLRCEVLDYYGTAVRCFSAAQSDVIRVSSMSDEEIIQEAMTIPEIRNKINLTSL